MRVLLLTVVFLFSFNSQAMDCVRDCINVCSKCLSSCQKFDGREYIDCINKCQSNYDTCEGKCFGEVK